MGIAKDADRDEGAAEDGVDHADDQADGDTDDRHDRKPEVSAGDACRTLRLRGRFVNLLLLHSKKLLQACFASLREQSRLAEVISVFMFAVSKSVPHGETVPAETFIP